MSYIKVILVTFMLLLGSLECDKRHNVLQEWNNSFWSSWSVASRFFTESGFFGLKKDLRHPPLTFREYVRTPYEIRKAYIQAYGSRVSKNKCMEYRSRYEFDSLINETREFVKPEFTTKANIIPGVFRIQAFGRNATGEEFPHMGVLGWRVNYKMYGSDWIFICGSSLISPNFVLTAAYCSRRSSIGFLDPRPQIVRLGAKDIRGVHNSSIDVYIKRIINYPDYRRRKQYNDIALMELKERVTFSMYIQPACVWVDSELVYSDTKIYGTGWEYRDFSIVEERNKTSLLQAVNVKMIDFKKCKSMFKTTSDRNFPGIWRSEICANVTNGRLDPCEGDVGGPIQIKATSALSQRDAGMSYLIGVLSHRVGCARPGVPLLYTNVSYYLDWIEDIAWDTELNSPLNIEDD